MSDYSNSEIPNGLYYADVAVLAKIFAKRYGTSVDAAYEWLTKDVEVPSADVQPVVQWIPCSERLPYAEYGESDNVLATCGHRNVEGGIIRWVRTLYFNGGNWCYPTGETYLEKVYAWMPLPEPYMRGEQDAEIR